MGHREESTIHSWQTQSIVTMGRTAILIFSFLALGLIAYNVTMVDLERPFEGDSVIAWIGIIAPLCAILILLIYRTSRKIQGKLRDD